VTDFEINVVCAAKYKGAVYVLSRA